VLQQRGIVYTVNRAKAMRIPANSSTIPLSERCELEAQQTLAQERSVQGPRFLYAKLANVVLVWNYNKQVYDRAVVDSLLQDDGVFDRIKCTIPLKKPLTDYTPEVLSGKDLREALANRDEIWTDIGTSDVCKAPIRIGKPAAPVARPAGPAPVEASKAE